MAKEKVDFQAIVEAAQDVIVVTKATPLDEPGPEIVYVNQAFTELTGYSAQEAIGQSPRFLQRPVSRELTDMDAMKETFRKGLPYSGEILNFAKDGTEYWLQMNIIPLKDASGKTTHFAAIERDISEQKRREGHLHSLTKKDALTGVVNRRGFDEILSSFVQNYRSNGLFFSLAIVDLDDFKDINDGYGHKSGDLALEHLTCELKKMLRQNDIVARYGGDEFCILLDDTPLEVATHLMQRIQNHIYSIPMTLENNQTCHISVSVGVTEIWQQDTDIDVFKRADKALYRAKQAGKNTVVANPAS